jgi:quinol-cytochrome oxidoreductase complex cytochrome b subunit
VFVIHVWLLPALLAPLIGAHLYLLRKHGEFGSEFEYSKRLAELRERQQIEEYALYEEGDESSRG